MKNDSHADRSRRDDQLDHLTVGYIERMNEGEILDPDKIELEHPEFATELLERLRAFQRVGDQKPSHALGTLGDYTLRRQIGRGGMGVVYEAWENSMDRAVALKVLPAGIAADTKACTRFMREAQTAGKLNHPNVVGVYSTGVKEGTPWYSMEYVEGETLAQILARIKDAEPDTETPFGPKNRQDFFIRLAAAFAEVADGLQHAHSKGVIHRDIKPSNLILDGEGRLRILDFGLARIEGQESLTLSGDFVGTPLYMSPEQARRKKIPLDHRTDVYSLGATLYEAICGQPPFRGRDHADTLSQIIERDPVEPHKVNSRVPNELETVGLKCLRKNSGDRYGTAEALGQDLKRFVRGDPIEARPKSRWEIWRAALWRRRVALAFLGLSVTLGLVVGWLLLSHWQESSRARDSLYRKLVLESAERLHLDYFTARLAEGRVRAQQREVDSLIDDRLLISEQAEGREPEDLLEQLRLAHALLPRHPGAPYSQARGLLSLGRTEDALDRLRSLLEQNPRFVPARVLIAVIHQEQGNEGEVERELSRARALSVDDWSDLWFRAQYTAMHGDWVSAEAAFSGLIAWRRGSQEAYIGDLFDYRMGRGIARLEQGDLLGAAGDFIRAGGQRPRALAPALLQGHALLLTESVGASRAVDAWFREFSETSQRRDEFSLRVGNLYLQPETGDRERAFEWFARIEEPWLRRCSRMAAHIELREFALAADIGDMLTTEGRHTIVSETLLAEAYSRIPGRVEEAFEMAERIVKRAPENPYVLLRAASILFFRDTEKCVEIAERAHMLDPDSSKLRVFLANALCWLGRQRDAKRVLEPLEKPPQESAKLHHVLGRIERRLGDVEKGMYHFRRSIELQPRRRNASRVWLAGALWNLGRYAEAEETFREALEVDPKDRHSRWQLGRLLHVLDRHDESLEHLCRAIPLELDIEMAPNPRRRLSSILRWKPRPVDLSPLDGFIEAIEQTFSGQELTAQVLDNLALAYLRAPERRDTERALELARQAVDESNRSNPDMLATLGTVLFETGNRREALLVLEEAASSPNVLVSQLEQLVDIRSAVSGFDAKSTISASSVDEFERRKRVADPPGATGRTDPIWINCGSRDGLPLSDGVASSTDRFFCGGESTRASGILPTSEKYFHTWRSFREEAAFPGYRIPLASGRYAVVLHFAEWEIDFRRLDVFLEGRLVKRAHDPLLVAGFGRDAPLEFVIQVDDGHLEIEVRSAEGERLRRPFVSAIEVLRDE